MIVESFQFGNILPSVIVPECLVSHDCWLVYLQKLKSSWMEQRNHRFFWVGRETSMEDLLQCHIELTTETLEVACQALRQSLQMQEGMQPFREEIR